MRDQPMSWDQFTHQRAVTQFGEYVQVSQNAMESEATIWLLLEKLGEAIMQAAYRRGYYADPAKRPKYAEVLLKTPQNNLDADPLSSGHFTIGAKILADLRADPMQFAAFLDSYSADMAVERSRWKEVRTLKGFLKQRRERLARRRELRKMFRDGIIGEEELSACLETL